jgi:integrase
MSKPTFPIEVKRGSVSVKIYKTPTRGWDAYTVVHYQDGKRVRTAFADLDKARTEAEVVATRLGNVEADVLTLTSSDRAAYLRARAVLDPVGLPIEAAAIEMAEATKRLRGVSLSRAVDFYLLRHPIDMIPRTVPEVVEELMALKQKDGLSTEYLRQLGMSLQAFAAKFTGPLGDVRGAAIDNWVRERNWAPRTRNNMRTCLQTLFNFAVARRYVPKDHDELSAVALAKNVEGDIEIFTPAELEEILAAAPEALIPFLVLGAFAGVRHAEIQRLDWRDIQLGHDLIEIRAANAKTASRRTIPIALNLKAWLLPHRQASGPVCRYRNASNTLQELVVAMNKLRKAVNREKQKGASRKRRGKKTTDHEAEVPGAEAEVGKEDWKFQWKRNALRHSFISYRVADIQNVAQVALEAGNSPAMIFSNYRELVTPQDAETWFGIVPPGTRLKAAGKKVVAMPQQAAA